MNKTSLFGSPTRHAGPSPLDGKDNSSKGSSSNAGPGDAIPVPHISLPTVRDEEEASDALAMPRSATAESQRATESPAQEYLMEARGVVKTYRKGRHEIPVLQGVDFAVAEGSFSAIVGQSGSGKSTLLHLLATLDQPDAGEIIFAERRIDNLPASSRDILRNRFLGMIFQFYHLLPELTTLENVLAPKMIEFGFFNYWRQRRTVLQKARNLLEEVGLSHRLHHKPGELSGGEMQRAAIARALITEPQVLLADEPTGNLDRKTGQDIMRILRSLNAEQKLTIVMVTHDMSIADQADHTLKLVEGVVQDA